MCDQDTLAQPPLSLGLRSKPTPQPLTTSPRGLTGGGSQKRRRSRVISRRCIELLPLPSLCNTGYPTLLTTQAAHCLTRAELKRMRGARKTLLMWCISMDAARRQAALRDAGGGQILGSAAHPAARIQLPTRPEHPKPPPGPKSRILIDSPSHQPPPCY